ncbi:unnamed protein product [Adineta steineri]|uniref:Uncharacterized protein n=1 Tax=Adineta steineri TaxID=433720 RepID=A0A815KLC3_9BILA|nr:unnamed protein product [Adineta steineri]CAF1612177.1 unnamed protein product [Adineta steineri]
MEQAASNNQQTAEFAGCGSDPNNVGSIQNVKDDSNSGGDVKELIALVGHGPSGQGSSCVGANGLAQANSLAANKM